MTGQTSRPTSPPTETRPVRQLPVRAPKTAEIQFFDFKFRSGLPLGVRLTYDVEFSQDGYYNPELHVFPVYDNEEWRSRIEMKVLNGSIAPQPAEEGSPQVRPNILAFGAGYLYKANTTYHFTAEMVPDYVVQNEAKTKFCLYDQKYKNADAKTRAVWAAIRASQTPVSYRCISTTQISTG